MGQLLRIILFIGPLIQSAHVCLFHCTWLHHYTVNGKYFNSFMKHIQQNELRQNDWMNKRKKNTAK